jgi:prepilin-type N-terminal cleavage/methylation domain-containing protein
VSRVVARVKQRIAGERGFTLVELLVTMIIMTIVLAGVTALFSSGLRAETDVAFRARSQSEARNALSYLRQEVHCASAVNPTDASAADGHAVSSVTLTLPAGCFRPASETAGTPSTWCTVMVSSYRYQLYRKSGSTCDNTGKLFADYLTNATPFGAYAQTTSALGYLNVMFVVDTNSQSLSPNAYKLTDDIVLRNSCRAAVCP